MMKVFIILGALCTMMAVGTGAFGAHGLEAQIVGQVYVCMGKSCELSNVSWTWLINYWGH